MNKMFQTAYNRHTVEGEKFHLPSRTVPDQSMTVKEIIRRFQQGLPVDGAKVPLYYEEEMPNWLKMDISEKFDLIRENQAKIMELRNLQEKNQLKEANEKLRASLEADIREKIKAEAKEAANTKTPEIDSNRS